MPTQDEYNKTKQGRILYTKINLLNFKFQKVDELSGVVIGNPSVNIDATSDIRRTLGISLYPKDSSFDIQYGNKLWLDKYVQIYIGIKNKNNEDITYSNMGIYLINNPSQIYNAQNNTISLSCIDLMAKMTGMRNGVLSETDYVIPQGTNIRGAIIALIKECGFAKYIVDECTISTPYEIRIGVGGTYYDALSQLRDILPNYQIYFDVDGVFHYNLIPNGENEQIMVNDDIWKNVLISYKRDYDYESVKNVVEVFGKTHDIDNYGVATLSGNTYNVTISSITNLYNYMEVGFTTSSSYTNPYLKINSLTSYQIVNEDGSSVIVKPNVYYVAKFNSVISKFIFLGEVSPHATLSETNVNSPFYINGTFGNVKIVLSGGEYDNINSEYLAKERCKFELYQRCRLLDNIVIETVPIYWLDVNWLIEITLPNKQGTETKEQYIIKNISTNIGVDGTQSITMMKYYPFYPSI